MLGVETAALPASLRRTNQRTLVSLLQRLGSASKAELAKAAGVSQPTAGKIITELAQLGLLEESDAGSELQVPGEDKPRLGRPGQLVRLDRRRARFVVVELGVQESCVAALPVAAQLRDEWTFTFPTPNSPEAWSAAFKRLVPRLASRDLWGTLVSVPGIVDERAGKVLLSPNLHWLERVDLPELIRRSLDLPVLLVQEIRTLALGQLAADPAEEDFLLVDFGIGVGGAVVRAGKLESSPLPMSGELGHAPIEGNQRPCGCGAVGCLETLVSRGGLLESFGKAHRLARPTWPKLVRHLSAHPMEPWLAQVLVTTAKVIAGALNVLGLRRVVVTGSLTELPGWTLELIGAELKKHTLWARFGKVVLEAAPRRRAAGLVSSGLDRLVLPMNQEQGMILQLKPATN